MQGTVPHSGPEAAGAHHHSIPDPRGTRPQRLTQMRSVAENSGQKKPFKEHTWTARVVPGADHTTASHYAAPQDVWASLGPRPLFPFPKAERP